MAIIHVHMHLNHNVPFGLHNLAIIVEHAQYPCHSLSQLSLIRVLCLWAKSPTIYNMCKDISEVQMSSTSVKSASGSFLGSAFYIHAGETAKDHSLLYPYYQAL